MSAKLLEERPPITVDENGGLFFSVGRLLRSSFRPVGTIGPQADWSSIITTPTALSTPSEIGHEVANSMASSDPHLPSHLGSPDLRGTRKFITDVGGSTHYESLIRASGNTQFTSPSVAGNARGEEIEPTEEEIDPAESSSGTFRYDCGLGALSTCASRGESS